MVRVVRWEAPIAARSDPAVASAAPAPPNATRNRRRVCMALGGFGPPNLGPCRQTLIHDYAWLAIRPI